MTQCQHQTVNKIFLHMVIAIAICVQEMVGEEEKLVLMLKTTLTTFAPSESKERMEGLLVLNM